MSDFVNISMILTPLNGGKLNLNLLVDKLKNDSVYVFHKAFNDFLIEFYNEEKYEKVLLYSNGMINYTECINSKDFFSNQIYITFKKFIVLLKYLNINIQYAKNLGVFINGNDPNICYEEFIHKFGQTIFKTPYYRDMNFSDDSTHYSVFIEENSDLVFEF